MITGLIVPGQMVAHMLTGKLYIVVCTGLMKTDVHFWQSSVTYRADMRDNSAGDIFTREESDFRLEFENWP